MTNIVNFYKNCYYALICINYFFMRFSITSDDYNIWNSANFALTLFTLMGGTLIWFAYIIIIEIDISNSNIYIPIMIFSIFGMLNYFLLYDKDKHYLYVKNKNMVPKYAYKAVLLFFIFFGLAMFGMSRLTL